MGIKSNWARVWEIKTNSKAWRRRQKTSRWSWVVNSCEGANQECITFSPGGGECVGSWSLFIANMKFSPLAHGQVIYSTKDGWIGQWVEDEWEGAKEEEPGHAKWKWRRRRRRCE